MSVIIDGTTGITTPGLINTGTETIVNLTTTGNTILGNAVGDTLNVSADSLVVDSSGNVGVGTASPGYKLHVVGGDVVFANTGAATQFISSSSGGAARLGFDSSGVAYNWIEGQSGGLRFATVNTERMRITAEGRLLFGSATNPSGGAVTQTLVGGPNGGAATGLQMIYNASTYGGGAIFASVTGGGLQFYTVTGNVGSETYYEKMSILQSGNILSLAGGSTTATGTGITFPATQSASSDANTLDDYEEGTFTPTFASSSGSITTYNSNGFYIKVGRLVFVQLYCNVTSVGTASGTLNFSGLPFGVNGAFGANQGQVAALLRESNMTGTTYYSYMPGGNSTSGYITSLSSGGITWSSNGIWPLTFTYYTSA